MLPHRGDFVLWGGGGIGIPRRRKKNPTARPTKRVYIQSSLRRDLNPRPLFVVVTSECFDHYYWAP